MRSNDDTLKPNILPNRRSPSPLRSPPLIPPSSPKKLILPFTKKCNLNFVLNPPSPRSPSQIRQRQEEVGGRKEEGGGRRDEGRREEKGRLEIGRKEDGRKEEGRRDDFRREEKEDVRREVREEGGGRRRGDSREESVGRRASRSREGRDILSRKRSADAPRNNPNLQKLLQNLMESGNSGRYVGNNNPTTQILKSRENSIERNSQKSGRGGVANTRYGRADNSDIMGTTTRNWNEISGLSGNLNVRNISDNNANLLKNEPNRIENKNEWKSDAIKNDPKNDWKNEGGRNDLKNDYKNEINSKCEYKNEPNHKNEWKIGETLRNDQKCEASGIKKSSSRLINAKNDNISIKKLLNLGRLLDGNEEILTEKKKLQNKEDVRSTMKENFNEFSLNVNINIENNLIKSATPITTPRNDKASLFKREEVRREEGRKEEENRRREEDSRREDSRREDSRREESRREDSRKEESRREEDGGRRKEEESGRRKEDEGGRRKEEEGRREEEGKTVRAGILDSKMKGMMKEQPKKEVMTRTGKDFFAGEEKKKDIEIHEKLCKEKIDNNFLQNIIRLEETLIEIIKTFKANHKIINICKTYLQIIADGMIESIELIFQKEEDKKTIKKMIILERVVIIAVISLSFNTNLDPKFISNSINLLQYIQQNFLILIEILLENIQCSENNEIFLQKMKQLLLMNKTRDTSKISKLEIVKTTCNCIVKILNVMYKKKNYNSIDIPFLIRIKQNRHEPFNTINDLLENLDKFSIPDSTQFLMQCFYTLIVDLEDKIEKKNDKNELFNDEEFSEQLTYVAPPYLPPFSKEKDKKMFTLVLDLDETLVHYEELEDNCGQFLVRPYAEEFLKEMSKYYEVVIFTAALQDYADYILDILDEKKNLISYRLYRKHTTHNGSIYVKDLSKIGRDLSKTIIVDNLADNFQNQPDNGIFIQSWYGEPEDQALYLLAPLLIEIVKKNFSDVKQALRKFKEQMIENINKGVQHPHLNLTLD